MNQQLKDNIITQIELEAKECPTVYAMFMANKQGVIDEIYNHARQSNEKSIQGAIYDLEQRYED